MPIAVLAIRAKKLKQLMLAVEWTKGMKGVCAVEYESTFKKEEVLSFETP